MPFTIFSYIVFFAVVFLGYYALAHRYRWMWLLAGSWVFYGWLSPYYLIFLGITTGATYFAAVIMARNHRREQEWIAANGKQVGRDEKKIYKTTMERRRWRLACWAIVGLLLMLVVFKYLEFLFSNISWLAGVVGIDCRLPTLNLILPIGLSFYVFQSMAYMIDVQRGEVSVERNFFRHALYVSYFPQIMQGPIGNYGRLAPQLFGRHDFDYEQVVLGAQRAAWGYFKKFMIANVIAQRIDPAWHNVAQYHGLLVWMVILFLYAVQLYADFSGYMDIACGCSRMLGIKLDENFNCPYFARSVSEFWRRWHMTLSSWFKDYLFYSVLRSDWNSRLRKTFSNKYLASVVPTSLALAVVWAATGLWHGASWGYVVWGAYYGIFMILAVALAPAYDAVHKKCPQIVESNGYALFQMIRTFLIVMIGYSLFKPESLRATLLIWREMTFGNVNEIVAQLHQVRYCLGIKVILGVVALFVVDLIHFKLGFGVIRGRIRMLPFFVRWPIYCIGVAVVVFFGRYGLDVQQFEYFKF